MAEKRQFLPFEEAREYVRKLKLNGVKEWNAYTKSENFPDFLPKRPETSYKNEFQGVADWLGTTRTKYLTRDQLMPFEDAREYVRKLKIKGQKEWYEWCKSGEKPDNIPTAPFAAYKDKWIGFSDWLGKERVKGAKARNYPDALAFARTLGLKSKDEWIEYCKGEIPFDIPKYPDETYRGKFKDWDDWLGIKINSQEKKNNRRDYSKFGFLPFEEAREYVRKLNLKGQKEWLAWCKSKPKFIPSTPHSTYREDWINLADWLGTTRTRSTNFLSFEEARSQVRKMNISGQPQWYDFCREKKIPLNIPNSPDVTYSKFWISWYDWLGNEDSSWSVSNVKELLRELINSRIIYDWDEAVLYSFLLRKGVLGTEGKHHEFFKDLIRASRDPEGIKIIEDYAQSELKEPPDLSPFAGNTLETDEEVTESNTEEEENNLISQEFTEDSEVAKRKQTPLQILQNTEILESISVDDEAMQFYVNYSINRLWEKAFENESDTIQQVKNSERGNKYRDLVIDTFLRDYSFTKNLRIPSEFNFPAEPFLMQLYVAYKVQTLPSFGNFSGTGAGKTLSAILSSMIIHSKTTLIVCPNDVVSHWVRNTSEIYPNSEITSGKDVFDYKINPQSNSFLVLNYDKLNQEDSANNVLKLSKQKIDFVILDEIHFSKISSDSTISIRRKNLEGLLTNARKLNPDIKILGLSATPVVNNLREGKSLLELMTGKIYDDLSTRPTIPNAVSLYEKLSKISIRQIPNYDISVEKEFVTVKAPIPSKDKITSMSRNPLSVEQILTEYRIPEIINRISGQTIIYTEYVTDIVEKIAYAVRNEGYSYGFYIGENDTGLEPFKKKQIQVLIASRPISTGIDGLQSVCNRLIFNTLPWTHALYQQLIGRIVRTGQGKNVVYLHHVLGEIGGYQYDELKLNRIKFKRTLADCAVDGILPEKNLITPQKATKEAISWLERLESGKVTTITRNDLEVNLTPTQIETRVRKFGDFSNMNKQFNTENSSTTHQRLKKDPEEWFEYHRLYREARNTWSIIPYEFWISRLQSLSPRLLIADLGCGEAKIGEAIGERVLNYDHISTDSNVTECDISKVPLSDSHVDVVVMSLSLMGKNWSDYISEAKRILVTNGDLFITITKNSLLDRLKDLRNIVVNSGFNILSDREISDFVFLECRKN